MRIKKGDKVKVIAGKDKGKTGKVLQISNKRNKITVEGVNLHYKNTRARKQGEKGQKIQFPAPLDVSNVAMLDPKSNKVTRIGYKIEGKVKTRISKKSKEAI